MRFILAAGVLFLLPMLAHAQDERQITVEASVFRGTVGYARAVSRVVLVGAEAGFGFPQIDRTLHPTEERWYGEARFSEFLHVGGYLRHQVAARWSYDVGARAGFVDLWSCVASDCWPGTFVGAYVQPMFGNGRWSVGPRVTTGWVAEAQDGGDKTFVVSLAPLNVRLTLGR
jgi:hypothetical protein